MVRNAFSEVDNRSAEHMFEYLEARIEIMKRRILELQVENEALRNQTLTSPHAMELTDGKINKINWGLVTLG